MADEPAAVTPDAPLEGAEVLALRIDLDLVPEWSAVVEKVARAHGERVFLGVEGGEFVVKVAVRPDRKAVLLGDVQRYWQGFVERRKREGRWTK